MKTTERVLFLEISRKKSSLMVNESSGTSKYRNKTSWHGQVSVRSANNGVGIIPLATAGAIGSHQLLNMLHDQVQSHWKRRIQLSKITILKLSGYVTAKKVTRWLKWCMRNHILLNILWMSIVTQQCVVTISPVPYGFFCWNFLEKIKTIHFWKA